MVFGGFDELIRDLFLPLLGSKTKIIQGAA
jgi:hypothetical protein